MGDKDTKFSLSKSECELLKDVTFFRLKRELTERIAEIFGNLQEKLQSVSEPFGNIIPEEAIIKKGKISRGENYLGLPYMVLDYPATFQKNDIFAFRTMMWWGHSFTCTFHLSGKYLKNLKPDFYADNKLESAEKIFICINDDMWIHHQERSNFIPLSEFKLKFGDPVNVALMKGFLKISIQIPIEESTELNKKIIKFFRYTLSQLN